MKRRTFVGGAMAVAVVGQGSRAQAQQPPIKIGMSMPQSGGLAGGGKASLLGIEIWRDESMPKAACSAARSSLWSMTTIERFRDAGDLCQADRCRQGRSAVCALCDGSDRADHAVVKQRGLLLMGNFSFQVNSKVGHDMWFNNAPWGPADSWATGSSISARRPAASRWRCCRRTRNSPRTSPDCEGCRQEVTCPSSSTSPIRRARRNSPRIIRALKAAKPDIVYVASYPPDSAGILRAVNEIGIGDNVKLFGGGMVGLQFAAVMDSLGSLLNGVVNYNTWLPEPSMYFDGTKKFFENYTKRAVEAKVDPLGFYLAPYGYAMGQMIEQAVTPPSRSTRRASPISARERAQDHRRTDRVFGGRRTEGNARPSRRNSAASRQGYRTIPPPGQAGDPVPRETEDRRARQPLRGCSQIGLAALLRATGQGSRGGFDVFSMELLLDAVVLGVLLGCFYAAVSVGLSISFGLLDVPHVAHPAFLVPASYGVFLLNDSYDIDPLLAGLSITPLFFLFGLLAYRIYYETFEKRGTDAGVRGIAFFFGIAFIIEALIILQFGVDQRSVTASYIGKSWRFGDMRIPSASWLPSQSRWR